MTEPSQYFKGRTVQEQMDEVIGYVDVRSAEVATDAIASDVAQVHSDAADAHSDALAAAASAAAAAGTLANAVKKTGEASQSIAGDIAVAGDLTGGTVTVPTPVNNTDAASKKYVDDQDALKLNITDVGSYAVLLTGNQDNISGRKSFLTAPVSKTTMGLSFVHQTTDFDHSSRPASNTTLRMLQVDDNAGHYVGRINLTADANGNLRLRFEGYVIDGDGNRIVKSTDIATLTP